MKQICRLTMTAVLVLTSATSWAQGLKDVYKDYFLVGVAVNQRNVTNADQQALIAKYTHPIIKKYGEEAKEVGGHGGMDFIMDSRFVYCLRNGLPLDMDVYDLAEWCCLAELGSISMDNGCLPVEVPDFTRGHWNDIKGYKHAFAAPADEAQTEEAGRAFTAQLKEFGALYWSTLEAKGEAAAQKALATAKKKAAKKAKK